MLLIPLIAYFHKESIRDQIFQGKIGGVHFQRLTGGFWFWASV